jgi:single-strand DNA-binding protein
VIGQYLKKGRPVLIEGRLRLDTWEDKNTHQKMSKLKVVLESFSFLDSRGDGPGPSPKAAPVIPPASAAAASGAEEMSGEPPNEDDVPF